MKQTFPEIDPSAWEHPADRVALQALRAVPGFEPLARASIGRLQDSFALRRLVGTAKPMAQDHPKIAALWQDTLATLDAPEPIPLLVAAGDTINGFTMGLRRPHVVLSSGAVEQLPTAQVRAILAHELGHVMSGHVLYKTLVRILDAGRWWLGASGLNLVITLPILLALYEWDRKSELSADRAELLVAGNPAVSIGLLRRSQAGVQDAMDQRYRQIAQVWKPGADALAAVERAFSRHPPLDERIAEIEAWAASDQLAAIRQGDYPRRPTDRTDVASLEARVTDLATRVGERLTTQGEAASTWLSQTSSEATAFGSELLRRLTERKSGQDR
ncbi:MAG: M48 family metallopeptidase [Oligoflexia bacterium]|nr:M48 family metallopeptidase [Oligoflexia bacterium]